ncbi:MAG: hypothetical protein E6654_16965, partial [Proteus mirabilis]|nr:hypothetical protein [Proteus mirabilis]
RCILHLPHSVSSANLSGFSLFILFSQPVRLAPYAVTTRTHYREFSEAGNSFLKKNVQQHI